LLRIIRRGTGSVVTWRWAQMVLLSPQGMAVAENAEVAFTSADRVRDVIHEAEQRAVDRLRDGCIRAPSERATSPSVRTPPPRWSSGSAHDRSDSS
jgi:hypothetical protein